MPLTVLNVSYPLAPVSVGTSGGAEQVISMLDEALVESGHHSLVLAPPGSRCCGLHLPALPVPSALDKETQHVAQEHIRQVMRDALERIPIDVVHLHGIDFREYLPDRAIPTLVTLHLPPQWYEIDKFPSLPTHVRLICVSQSQYLSFPSGSSIDSVVPNGVDLNRFYPNHRISGYVLALGRICPEKGFHLAIDACENAGLPFVLAGTVFQYQSHCKYFEDLIRPRLSSRCRFVGAVAGERKRALLAGAVCVLIPSLVNETSSLVAMEAMACGTPVVAYPKGALRELITPGVTGFLVNNVDEMSAAIGAIPYLSRKACREYAERHFSAEAMTKKYIAEYSALKREWSTEPIKKEIPCCV